MDEDIFVGRRSELAAFSRLLEKEEGRTILVEGQQGMGKSMLLKQMAAVADHHATIRCGHVFFETSPTDTIDSILGWIMDSANDAAASIKGRDRLTSASKEQWKAFFGALGLIPLLGRPVEKLGDLLLSFERDPTGNTRSQFLDVISKLSKRLKQNSRAIFFIDPQKGLQQESEHAWSLISRELPPRVILVFAQRPEDILADSATFRKMQNVSCIPDGSLGVLSPSEIDELVALRCSKSQLDSSVVSARIRSYSGHPYALDAALRLVASGVSLDDLPADPSGIASYQWREIGRVGAKAIVLFEAYAVYSTPLPDEAIEKICEITPAEHKNILVHKYLGPLIKGDGNGRRIYHSILSDFIKGQIGRMRQEYFQNKLAALLRSDRTSERLYQTIFHEIRQPLGLIRNALALEDREIGAEKRNRIRKGIREAVEMIEAVIEAGTLVAFSGEQVRPPSRKIDILAEVIRPTIRSLSLTLEDAKFKPKQILLRGFETLPLLYLDAPLLRVATRNILRNCVKYAERNPGAFKVEILARMSESRFQFLFRDWGIGIDASAHSNIFRQGFRGEAARQTSPSGLGMGLFVARKVVESLGGSLVISNTRAPTEFVMEWPRSIEMRPLVPSTLEGYSSLIES